LWVPLISLYVPDSKTLLTQHLVGFGKSWWRDLRSRRAMQQTNKDEGIQGVDTMLFAGLKHKESIYTHELLSAVSSGKDASSADDDHIKG